MVSLSLSGNYNRVSADSTHFYLVGDTGLDIINRHSGLAEGFVSFSGGFSSVWAEDDLFVYLGHSVSGLYFLEKPDQFRVGQNLTSELARDYRNNAFQSLNILAIGGIDKDYFAIGTASGVELVTSPSGIFYSNSLPGVQTVSINSSTLDLYYGGYFGLAFKRGPISANWMGPDEQMQAPFLPHTTVYDTDVLVESGDALIGVATQSGIVLIRQRDPIIFSPTTKLFTSGA